MARILNILLLLIAIVGAFYAWRARTEFEATRREHTRLMSKVGRLPIGDESKMHLVAVDTADPLDFRWQVYLPAKMRAKWHCAQIGGGSSSFGGSNSQPQTRLVRVRFRKIDGEWHMWRKFINSSGAGRVRYGEELETPELLTFQQLGQEGVKVIEPDEIATLLTITSQQQPPQPSDDGKPLLTVRVGARDAF